MLDKTLHRLQSYKRKFMYLLTSAQNPKHKKKMLKQQVEHGKLLKGSSNKHGFPNKLLSQQSNLNEDRKKSAVASKVVSSNEDHIPKSMQHNLITVEQSIDLPFNDFNGKNYEALLEMNVTLCRIFSELFNKLYVAYNGMNLLINACN